MDFKQAQTAFKTVMSGFQGAWCIAGGWALDFYQNKQSRSHEDLEIVVLRNQLDLIYPHFKRFNPQYIIKETDEPKFFKWNGEEIDSRSIQIRIDPVQGVDFDLLLTPSEKDTWICRRDESIRLPLGDVAMMSQSGLPILAPEIVLLFKAKKTRPKDEEDFKRFFPMLTPQRKEWLMYCVQKTSPAHQWLNVR